MVALKISRGLDIPIKGGPEGEIHDLSMPSGLFALELKGFTGMKLKLLKKEGDSVQQGEALALDKSCPERLFVSPAGGTVKQILRGPKRRLDYIVVERESNEEKKALKVPKLSQASREEILACLLESGMMTRIRRRPFSLLALPEEKPKSIFVKALESAPFLPPCEMQVQGFEKEFATGLKVLQRLTEGKVHLVHKKGSSCTAFTKAEGVVMHSAEGPHPIGNPSLHIHFLDPIRSLEDVVWTIHAHDVISLGTLFERGHLHFERVISIAGTGFHEERRGFFRVREGVSVADLVANRNAHELVRFISGDPLTGGEVSGSEFLGMRAFALTALQENSQRELLHFFRLGCKKYTASRTYLSGFLPGSEYTFTTNQHGEERAFVDTSIYQKVMPMRIPAAELVKSVLAEDFETAEALGILEVDSEDFALPTFICPSKVEMQDIMKEGIAHYAQEIMG